MFKLNLSGSSIGSMGLALTLALAFTSVSTTSQATEFEEVVSNYADIGLANFSDSLSSAKELREVVNALLREPNEDNLELAQRAWQTARIIYQQTEVFRYGSPLVEEWEQRVNAWPVDEGFLDYVDDTYTSLTSDNALYIANIVSNSDLTIDGEAISIPQLTPEVISSQLHGAGGAPANVASGYHAIEFLLWGQDLSETSEGEGERPASDFDTQNCAIGNCDRRSQYLLAATDLLIADLEEMVRHWEVTGEARRALVEEPEIGLAAMLRGMGSLALGELAGDTFQRALNLADPKFEIDEFSDYSYASYLLSIRGISNIYLGEYFSLNGDVIKGPALADLVLERDSELHDQLLVAFSNTAARARMMVRYVRDEESFDVMIARDNSEGRARVQAIIDALIAEADALAALPELFELEPVEFMSSQAF